MSAGDLDLTKEQVLDDIDHLREAAFEVGITLGLVTTGEARDALEVAHGIILSTVADLTEALEPPVPAEDL